MRWRAVALALAWLLTWVAACSIVNAPDDPVDPSASDGGGGVGPGGGGPGGAAPGCQNGERDGDESDVDCGGSCSPCPDGRACSAASDCSSGFCPSDDGVCCDSVCDGLCEACAADKTGVDAGECAPITSGEDPEAECSTTPVAECGVSGMGCDGAGSCLLYPSNTECAPRSCAAGMASGPSLCNGQGDCVAATPMSCAPYACDPGTMSCTTQCVDPDDCTPPAQCGTSGQCIPTVVFDTHNFAGMTEYPLDTDVCGCCGATTTAETAQAFCILAGMSVAIGWTTGQITGDNCYCYDCITVDTWASNCCGGNGPRPMILTVTCQ